MDTHAFLHGKPTLLPGSVTNGVAECGEVWCNSRASEVKKMQQDNVEPKDEMREVYACVAESKECSKCKKEREKRILVAADSTDKRFSQQKFLRAPAVLPNNDMKYEVNKKRALGYANKLQTGVLYCPAKDSPSHEALRIRPDLPSQKLHG